MQEQYLNPLKTLNYSALSQEEENELKNVEEQFNHNFNKDVYFMVMEK
ncbi:MAG: polynucleotide phosphorylase [Anaerovorax sp.]|nr:polynucleotide phosphorylase [Anaerovorax sp.]